MQERLSTFRSAVRHGSRMASAVCVAVWLPSTAVRSAEIEHKAFDGLGVISITGEINAGDVERFRKLSLRYPKAVVGLDSPGGYVMPALEIGRLIRMAGFATVVIEDTTCVSSCALIWLGGTERFLSPKGRVGFHASYRDNRGRLEESGVANALVGNYLTQLNEPRRAIVFATSASPTQILWLTRANSAAAGITFTDWKVQSDNRSARTREEVATGIRIRIGTDGRVSACSVVRSSGFSRLDESACDIAQRRWRFNPATENGRPVEETVTRSFGWQHLGGDEYKPASSAATSTAPPAFERTTPVVARVPDKQAPFTDPDTGEVYEDCVSKDQADPYSAVCTDPKSGKVFDFTLSDWVEYATDNAGTVYRFNRKSVEALIGGVFSVWVKYDHSKDSTISHRSTTELRQVSCPTKTSRAMEYIEYDKNGAILTSESLPNNGTNQFKKLVPDSVGMALFEKVCL
jgi:TonB family protein